MTRLKMTGGPSGNLEFAVEAIDITSTADLSVGTVVEFALADGSYSSVNVTDTADIGAGMIIGVALESCAANEKCRIAISGSVNIRCDTEVAAGDVLCVSAGHVGNLDALANPAADGTTRGKAVGFALEASASDTDLVPCIFDGVMGVSACQL